MKSWWLAGMVAGLSLLFVGPAPRAEEPDNSISTPDLELLVNAMTTINDLDLTPQQVKMMQDLASDTAGKVDPDDSKTDDNYRTALLSLRDALLSGDDDKIGDAEDKVDDLQDKLDIDPNGPDFDTTTAAKKKAGQVLKMLSTSQIANYISEHSDDVPDALDTIMDAIDQCKDGDAEDFKSLKQEAAEQVALLAHGPESTAESTIGKKVSSLLDKARKMSDPSKQRDQLEQEAKEIVKSIDSFDAMRRWMLREMADVLSNPQVNKALELRAKSQANEKTTEE
jgi:hypothetical protein